MKPEASSQGKGIFLVKSYEEIPSLERYVVQKYIPRPLLIEGLKFDLRLYVLLACCDPLRIFIYKDGLARLATKKYQKPTSKNMSNTYMHLTNYSINKFSKEF